MRDVRKRTMNRGMPEWALTPPQDTSPIGRRQGTMRRLLGLRLVLEFLFTLTRVVGDAVLRNSQDDATWLHSVLHCGGI